MKPNFPVTLLALLTGLMLTSACQGGRQAPELPLRQTLLPTMVVTSPPIFLPLTPGQSPDAPARLTSPLPGEVINSPVTIEGEARGTWYFEASFPILLYDSDGTLLGTAIAQAQGDWMTEDYVPFTAALEFSPPAADTGTLVLERSNPSGLPENSGEIHIPIRFR